MAGANWYVSSAGWTAVAQYANGHAYTLGQYIRQLAAPTFGNERVFKCTTAGTSGGSEPAWNLGNSATTTAGTAVFTQVAGQEAEQASANWKAPFANLQGWLNAINSTGDTIFLSSDHAESSSASLTYNFGLPTGIYCVSRGVGSHVPPQSADYTTGASIECTLNQNLSWTCQYVNGVNLKSGTSTGSGAPVLRPRGNRITLEHCIITCGGTGGGVTQVGAGDLGAIVMNDVSFAFAATTGAITANGFCSWEWYNSTAVVGSFSPAILFAGGTGQNTSQKFRGIDFVGGTGATRVFPSAGSNAMTYSGPVEWADCIIPNLMTIANMSAFTAKPGTDWKFSNTNSGNVTIAFGHATDTGYCNQTSTVARAGGAQIGTSKYGVVVQKDSTGSNGPLNPYRGPELSQPNVLTGSKTLSFYLASTAALDNAQAWLEVGVLEDASDVLGATHSTRAAWAATPTGLSADTSDWTGGSSTGSRQNSNAYAVGAPYKAASNPGRIFICTTAGTSASSEPGAVASAVDGSSFSDGTATFIAAFRYVITVAITPARNGWIKVKPCFALTAAAANLLYFDPQFTVA
jgi:hypothetical protein